MIDISRMNPEEVASLLKADTIAADANPNEHSVWLTTENGRLVLNWKAPYIGKYDWVGLFKSNDDSDSDYIRGNNWQWALYGQSYPTTTASGSAAGYQARYLVWDYASSQYRTVARSNPF